MLVKRRSELSGVVREMELPVTVEKLAAWARGEGLIQEIFPELNPDQREFIMTGITKEEWDATFKEDDEEDDEAASVTLSKVYPTTPR